VRGVGAAAAAEAAGVIVDTAGLGVGPGAVAGTTTAGITVFGLGEEAREEKKDEEGEVGHF